MADNRPGQPGNTANLRHGLRSPRVLRENRRRLKAKYRPIVLALKPELNPIELMIGIDICADLEQTQNWLDSLGGPWTRDGRRRTIASEAKNQLWGRWSEWCRRNRIGGDFEPSKPPESGSLADLLDRLNQEAR